VSGCTALTNWIFTSGLTRPRSAAAVVPVLIPSLVLGLILAFALLPYLFESDVVDLHFADIPRLEAEVGELKAIAVNPPRAEVDKDPAVVPFVKAYEEADDAFTAAEKSYLDELDGTGGTRDDGPGPVSEEKKEARDRRTRERDTAFTRLEEARSAARTRIDAAADAAAQHAGEQRDDRAAMLEPLLAQRARTEEGTEDLDLKTHVRAIPDVVSRRPLLVPATLLGVALTYVLLSMVPLCFPQQVAREQRRERRRVEAERRRWQEDRVSRNGSGDDPAPRVATDETGS
jgi:hypothetical protein